MHETLSQKFDAVVMLTFSKWHTEMRSNRYHYATRFARHLPVIFVQPDLEEPGFRYEPTEVRGMSLLHLYSRYGWKQNGLLNAALVQRRVRKSLAWVYNFRFLDFLALRRNEFTVYHASEDYFSPAFMLSERSLNDLRTALRLSDLVVAVSEGVRDSIVERGCYGGETLVVQNGCDYKFWALAPEAVASDIQAGGRPIAFYQGGIKHMMDFPLLLEIVRRLPGWEFWFCGEVQPGLSEWSSLRGHANVKYHGKLAPEELRRLMYRSTVGLIPFVQDDLIVNRAFPLKAFEYIACGLPVVSVPIKALQPYSNVITFAETAGQFVAALEKEAPTRFSAEAIARRLKIAQSQDYDLRFDTLLFSRAFTAISTSGKKARVNAWFIRMFLTKSFVDNFKSEAFCLLRVLARLVIHLGARMIAIVLRRDAEQLEQELMRLSRRARGYGG